jgi:hypothetical protein
VRGISNCGRGVIFGQRYCAILAARRGPLARSWLHAGMSAHATMRRKTRIE